VAEKSAQGATYRDVALDYFDKRGLQRHAGLLALWGLGVAAVVSGDFSGWNFGLDAAGWGGLFIATVLVVIMYYGMLFSIGEMSAALPHTGGAYSFARSAMGPWGGFVTGFAETIEYVATTAVIVFFSASYADGIISQLTGASLPVWLWWIILYAIFLMLNIAGAEVSFKFAIVVAIASLAVLAMFAILAIVSGKFSIDNLFDIAPTDGNSTFLPKGIWAVVAAMPFAMWFFLGIEELPLAAEEAHNPVKDIPRAGILGLGTLVVTATLVLVLNPGVTGSSKIATSGEPLLDGFRAILPNANVAALLAAFALIGLFASLQGIMFAYGRSTIRRCNCRCSGIKHCSMGCCYCLHVANGFLPIAKEEHAKFEATIQESSRFCRSLGGWNFGISCLHWPTIKPCIQTSNHCDCNRLYLGSAVLRSGG